MKIVILISAIAEWRVVKELFPALELQHSPFGEFANLILDTWPVTLFHGGWGKISAAATAGPPPPQKRPPPGSLRLPPSPLQGER